jgi:hypothetical protein
MKKHFCYFTLLSLVICFSTNHLRGEDNHFSMIDIYLMNYTLKLSAPVSLWFNDSLIFTKVGGNFYNVEYKMFSKGNFKITAQIGGYPETKTEYSLNVLNDSCYRVIVQFDGAKYPGSIFQVRKIDRINFEPYFEESVKNETLINQEVNTQNAAVCQVLLHNDSWKLGAPISLRINDQPVIKNFPTGNPYTRLYCKLLSAGKVRISAQLGNNVNTKTEKVLEVRNTGTNYIDITFSKKDAPGIITLMDKENGSIASQTLLENWTLLKPLDGSIVKLEESISHPIPHMLDNTAYFASQEQYHKRADSLAEARNKYPPLMQQDSTGNIADNDQNAALNEASDDTRKETEQKKNVNPGFDDLIIRKNGEKIVCKITEVQDENIYYDFMQGDQQVSTLLKRVEVREYKYDAITHKPLNIHACATITPLSFLVLGPTFTWELTLGRIGLFAGYRMTGLGLVTRNLVYSDMEMTLSSYTIPVALRLYDKSDKGSYWAIYTEFGKAYYNSGESTDNVSIYGAEFGYREHAGGPTVLDGSLVLGYIEFRGGGIISLIRFPYLAINIRYGFML